MARESRQRKKEYIQSLESEIEGLKSTIIELRSEIALKKSKTSFEELCKNPNSAEAQRCIREEIMKHMEKMVNQQSDQTDHHSQENDLKECIGYLDTNHGVLSQNRKSMIRKNFKKLIDRLLPDFVK